MDAPAARDIRLAPADPRDPRLAGLIALHAAHGDAHYPAESNHHMSADELVGAGARFFALWLGDEVVGMGALAALDAENAEIKSMHVREAFRGLGLGARMLDHLIAEGGRAGYRNLWLETGSRDASAAARALYETRGFRDCPPFGAYVADPESVFMTLTLG